MMNNCRKCICVLAFSAFMMQAFSFPADSTPVVIIMGNGDSLLVTPRGDEYVSWFETDDGQIILPNV